MSKKSEKPAEKTAQIKQSKKIKQPKVAKLRKPVKVKAPSDKLADRTTQTKILQTVFGDAQKRILKRLQPTLPQGTVSSEASPKSMASRLVRIAYCPS